MSGPHCIGDFDLLAYADGALDDDPQRKAQVEAWLEVDPEDRKRVEDFRDQARLLRSVYGGRLHEPVPERLRNALVVPSPRNRLAPAALRAAGLAFLVGSSSAVGWLMASSGHGDPWSDPFFHRDLAELAIVAPGNSARAQGIVPGNASARPDRLSTGLARAFPPPDMREQGYRLVDREALVIGEREVLRHSYVDREGRGFNLFLRPRNDRRPTEVEVVEGSRAAFAHWREGPVAWAIAARRPAGEVRRLAEEVRHALEHRKFDPSSAAIFEPVPDLRDGFGPASLPDAVPETPEATSDRIEAAGQN